MAGARRVRRPPAARLRAGKRAPQAAETPVGLEEEVEMLRDVIRKLAARGDVKEARHQVDTLCRVLRTRYTLDDHTADSLAAVLMDTLEDAGRACEVQP